jgi:hypothetical protein
MRKMTEVIALALIVILIGNIVLLALGRMPVLWFFIILGLCALMAYKGIPYLRRL